MPIAVTVVVLVAGSYLSCLVDALVALIRGE
jgi:hypothetical protein